MDNQSPSSDQSKNFGKAVKVSIIFGIILIAISVSYYFIYKPYKKEKATKYCHQWASQQSKVYNGINEKKYNEKFSWCMNEQGE